MWGASGQRGRGLAPRLGGVLVAAVALALVVVAGSACAPRGTPTPGATAGKFRTRPTPEAPPEDDGPVATRAAAHFVQCAEPGRVLSRRSGRYEVAVCGAAMFVEVYSSTRAQACFFDASAGRGMVCIERVTWRITMADDGTGQALPASGPSTSSSTSGSSSSGGEVYVHGYRRRDGTYVRPHTRRRPR